MRWRSFILLAALLSGAFLGLLLFQWRQIERLRAASASATLPAPGPSIANPATRDGTASSPPAELLKLRAEVTQLRQELATPPPVQHPLETRLLADEWAYAHNGPPLSSQPGFHFFSELGRPGFDTPEAAFESFMLALLHPEKKRLTETEMKEIWDLPDDYDDPRAKYSIGLGEGIGREHGYLIRDQQALDTNAVKLTIDFETPDGTVYRRERVLIQRNGRWRVKPESLQRAN